MIEVSTKYQKFYCSITTKIILIRPNSDTITTYTKKINVCFQNVLCVEVQSQTLKRFNINKDKNIHRLKYLILLNN